MELSPERAFRIASGSGDGVLEEDSFKSKNFSIISRRESISSLCLAWIAVTAVATADDTTLVIDGWREASMTWELAIISSKRETVAENLSRSMSQEEL